MFTLPHNTDFIKPFSQELQKIGPHDTKRCFFFEKSPLPRVTQSRTALAKCREHPFYIQENGKYVPPDRDVVSLGVGKFYWIPPLDDEKDIVRRKWPQRREVVQPTEDDIMITVPKPEPMHDLGERENFAYRNQRLRWKSHAKRNMFELQQKNQYGRVDPQLEASSDQVGRKVYRERDTVDAWDRLEVKWRKMKIATPFDDWIEDTARANPLIRTTLKPAPLVEERTAALKATTTEAAGNKVNYECRCRNMPDRQGRIFRSDKDIDYSRALEDPRMDYANRTYRTFPIDMVRDRSYMRSQQIQPLARIHNINYTQNPYKHERLEGKSQLAALKYSDPNYPCNQEYAKYQMSRIRNMGRR